MTLYTKKEVAAMLKCSVSKVEKMMRAGEITFEKIGALVRFRPSDIAPFFAGATSSPSSVQVLFTHDDVLEKTITYGSGRAEK